MNKSDDLNRHSTFIFSITQLSFALIGHNYAVDVAETY